MRWIVSDPITEETLKPMVRGDQIEIGLGASPLREALSRREPTLLALPSRNGKLLLARINGPLPKQRPVEQEHFGYQPSGFLGLSDELYYDDEPEPPKKKKRFWQ